ncbi:MAG: acyl-CoA thioester hydrolase [Patiriisocius sp.]|jgi:acyl-CoA thioester hydrolase
MICITKIHIRFADIDSMGHVNNATYLSYFEQARMDFFQKKFNGEWDWQKDGIVLVKNEIEYLIPVFLNDSIFIETTISKVGSKSFTLTYMVKKINGDSEIFCTKGLSILVSYDLIKMASKVIPPKWKKVLEDELK